MLSALLLALSVLSGAGSQAAELKIGLIPEQNVFKQKERYEPLGSYLTKKTGIPLKFTILTRYGNVIDRFKEDRLDGAFFGSFTGALAIERLGVEMIARPVNLDGTSTYKGYLFVRKDGGIRTVQDMKGKKLVFVEKATTAGYVFPVAYFKKHGVGRLDRHFREIYFAGSHDAAIHAVLDRKADVGAAKDSMFDRVARRDPRVKRELVVLAESPDVPSNGLGIRRDLPPEVKSGLRSALLGMDKDPEGVQVLREFEALRFIPLAAADYAPVYEIAAQAGIDLKTYDYVNQ